MFALHISVCLCVCMYVCMFIYLLGCLLKTPTRKAALMLFCSPDISFRKAPLFLQSTTIPPVFKYVHAHRILLSVVVDTAIGYTTIRH